MFPEVLKRVLFYIRRRGKAIGRVWTFNGWLVWKSLLCAFLPGMKN